jgi:hypothetical protein
MSAEAKRRVVHVELADAVDGSHRSVYPREQISE